MCFWTLFVLLLMANHGMAWVCIKVMYHFDIFYAMRFFFSEPPDDV